MENTLDRSTQFPEFYVAIGASGRDGLADIKTLINSFPARLAAVVLVVLHRPSESISYLCTVLSYGSSMPIRIAEEGQTYAAGTCYIGEPAAHLALASRNRIRLVAGANNIYRNRTVDILFASVAMHAKQRCIGVVLSGDLDDGSRGLAAIHHHNGVTMVLARQQSIARGMPENATSYDGPIDFIGSIAEIGREILSRIGIYMSSVQPTAVSMQ